MRVPDFVDPIRVRWYAVPRPAPGSYELTDYSSSDWDEDPKSLDPDPGEQSSVRMPWTDWRDCSAPPFPPVPQAMVGAGFLSSVVLRLTTNALGLNRTFGLEPLPYPTYAFKETATSVAIIAYTLALPPPPHTTTTPVQWLLTPGPKFLTAVASFTGFGGEAVTLTYRLYPNPVTAAVPLFAASEDNAAWDDSTLLLPGYGGKVEDDMIIGQVFQYAGAGAAPAKCLECDGTRVLQGSYPELFAALGFAWGADLGDGKFTLPDLRNRALVGSGDTYALAQTFGESTHTLLAAEMPTHNHGFFDPGHSHDFGGGNSVVMGAAIAHSVTSGTGQTSGIARAGETADTSTSGAPTGITFNAAGGGAAHNNLQPSAAVRNLIYAGR